MPLWFIVSFTLLMANSVNKANSAETKVYIPKDDKIERLERKIDQLTNTVQWFIKTKQDERMQLINWNRCQEACNISAPWPKYDSERGVWEEHEEEIRAKADNCHANCNKNQPPEVSMSGC